jgi:hypothetical protein
MRLPTLTGAALSILLGLSGCASPRNYAYRFVPGKTAVLCDGKAEAPPNAPHEVHAAVAAGNALVGLPYRYGGGHSPGLCSGYDCSGAASHVLKAAGKLSTPIPSSSFRRYGKSGPGDWISVYARNGHVFLVVAGLRYDTGYTEQEHGPRWSTLGRPATGCVVRHPEGL